MSELTLQKITEKTVANVLKSDAHVLVSQTDTVGGNSMETLRRVPVDTVVADLKEIVEEDVADLKSAINEVSADDYVELRIPSVTTGEYIDYRNGALSSAEMYNSTDYIPVSIIESIKYKRAGTSASSTYSGIAFYDKEKQFISGVPSAFSQPQTGYLQELQTINIPETAVYVRCSMYANTTTYGEFAIYGITSIAQMLLKMDSDDFVPVAFQTAQTGKCIYYADGTVGNGDYYSVTDYVDVHKFGEISYKRTGTTYSSTSAGIAFYDKNKVFISGVSGATSQQATGYADGLYIVKVPSNAIYARFSMYTDRITYGFFELYANSKTVIEIQTLQDEIDSINEFLEKDIDETVSVPFTTAQTGKCIYYANGTVGNGDNYSVTDYIDVSKYGDVSYKRTGTTFSSTSAGMAFYDENKTYISGISSATSQQATGYTSGLYRATIPENAVYARFSMYTNSATYGVFELYARSKTGAKFQTLQNDVSLVNGSHWKGKVWYGYGTSITNTASEGKYATYLAKMSGLTFVNKGISGGGIGNLGGYARGQVYSAICNITDGKLNADLITLETGANDVRAEVPLGTIYDTGTSTLAGCLNDCIRYLQINTNAQICIINSPASTTPPAAENKYYEWADMVRQICDINRVHFLNNNSNMGYAKLADATKGSLYVVDDLHQTDLGGYIMAENLWYQLRNIPLFYTSMPSI